VNDFQAIGHATSVLFLFGFIAFILIIKKKLHKVVKKSRKATKRFKQYEQARANQKGS